MDKAYDCDGIIPVIPPRANRKEPREYDKRVYKEHHLVEYFNGKLKQFRRVFSRFDNWAKNFMNFVRFAAAFIWLR
uniref:Transposase DDE domain-containing protein n=1 Tax=Candidatus Kentrum eta TaxID=2126337 RepID=A0A450VI38_9GAMM|nr:MAG: Transposase DDE domain-containing protein [Candidatus Kentron sp. H]VFJ99527.1 MAG: Transposase DDE domain-containing protein [Candidatus Kentron sp. H]VFK04418.1 MAG: Transposase DDE domain-containing protein [Candidatus Kentron sp. H]